MLYEDEDSDVREIVTMCSVLQRPIPSAPLFLAVSASSGVSAFAITYYSIVPVNYIIEFPTTDNASPYSS
jgi:hypothetical protein